MTSSLPEGSVRPYSAAPVTAVEWDPTELVRSGSHIDPYAAALVEEQDDLIAAIAQANAEREKEVAAELERRVSDAYKRGFEEGRVEGETAEGARLRAAVSASEEALDEIRSSENRWMGGLEENICALAIAVAKQVLGRELRSDVDAVIDLVRRAVAEFPIDQPIRIRVAPGDLALISAASASASPPAIAPGRDSRWLADPLIAPGGCVVEGRERIVDGRVDTALERLYRRLTYNYA